MCRVYECPVCAPNTGQYIRHYYSDPSICPRLEIKIRQAFVEYIADSWVNSGWVTVDKVFVWAYYGTFSSSSVVMISIEDMDYSDYASWLDVVAGIDFYIHSSARHRVFYRGEFFSLQQAYAGALLTVWDLSIILGVEGYSVPFKQQITIGRNLIENFIPPQYTHFDNDLDTYNGGYRGRPHDTHVPSWWLNPESHGVNFCDEQIAFDILLLHPDSGVTAWIRDIKILGNTIIVNINRIAAEIGLRVITSVNITAQVDRAYAQNITGYRIITRDVRFAGSNNAQQNT